MPHIKVSMYPGRSEEMKEQIAAKLHETLVNELGCGAAAVSVSVEDVAPENWDEEMAKAVKPGELFVASDFVKGE